MRLRNGAGSKRVTTRTAERREARPSHNPPAAVPMGVTAPTPVTTTRRSPLPLFTNPLLLTPGFRPGFVQQDANEALRTPGASPGMSSSSPGHPPSAFQSCQRARCDAVHEHRADDEVGREAPDQRPARPCPLVNDRHVHVVPDGNEPPDDVHPGRDTPDVAVADFPAGAVHR